MPELFVQIAAAKIAKYATSESGDSLEMIERPQGGISVVLADGQRSGKSAKSISNIVVRKAISLLGDGVRDGAVARAAHDYLRTMRGGKVSATLNIASLDLQTETIVLSRNSHCPTLIVSGDTTTIINQASEPIGIHTWTKPVVTEIPIQAGTCVVVCTDGVIHAGRKYGKKIDLVQYIQALALEHDLQAQAIADALLTKAMDCDCGRPSDDISVLVFTVQKNKSKDEIRHMSVVFPIRVNQPV